MLVQLSVKSVDVPLTDEAADDPETGTSDNETAAVLVARLL